MTLHLQGRTVPRLPDSGQRFDGVPGVRRGRDQTLGSWAAAVYIVGRSAVDLRPWLAPAWAPTRSATSSRYPGYEHDCRTLEIEGRPEGVINKSHGVRRRFAESLDHEAVVERLELIQDQ
jgi:hypothetical protein